MKRRIYASLLGSLLGALSLSACDSGDDYSYAYGYGAGAECRQYTPCGTCTPVMGCGWCQSGVGKGMCADDPNDCAGASAFSWTWDPSGCFAPIADASVSIPEAASTTPPDTGTSPTVDAGSTPSDAAVDAPIH
jgi:hypothetical protein